MIRYFLDGEFMYREITGIDGSVIIDYVGFAITIELSYDGTNVTAIVKNYLGEMQTDFTDPIIFDVDGAKAKALPANGQASIAVPAGHAVKTVNAGVGNSEITTGVV